MIYAWKWIGIFWTCLVEVYVDDIVVKTREATSLLENLAQVFDKLRATCTKLNFE